MHCKSYSHFFSKKFQRICVSLDVNFNESLTNDVVSFEQPGPDDYDDDNDVDNHGELKFNYTSKYECHLQGETDIMLMSQVWMKIQQFEQ